MAAGLGFKTFTTGEVLTAADTNGYLMQGVNVFTNAAARDAAITSPQEGQFAFLKDTDLTTYYTGSAWAAVASAVNLLLNSNFALNQRVYVSAANLASGSYGFDRWKSNFTNTTLTFTASTQGQSITINSGGGLQQVIEQGLVPAGTYTLSWTGTATGRVYNSGGTPPSYAASPVTFTADGTANVVVEFTATGATKTLSKVQFNAGGNTTWSLATPTLQSELAACQRYYAKSYENAIAPATNSSAGGLVMVQTTATVASGAYFGGVRFPVTMRVAPTVTIYSFTSSTSGVVSNGDGTDLSASSGSTNLIGNASFGLQNNNASLITASRGGFVCHFVASAEL
jgi:hypothetical protein